MANPSVFTVYQLLEKAARENPDKEALYDRTRRLSYRDLREESDRLAQALLAFGIKKGDRVGVCLPNWHETAELFFAAAKIGAILVSFNPRYRLHEVQHILRDSAPSLLFVCEELAQNLGLREIAALVPAIVTVRFAQEGYLSFADFLQKANGQKLGEGEIDPVEDVFCILYTSGTTGLPKGAMLTHRNVTMSAMNVVTLLKCDSDDVFLVPAPLFHVFGMCPCLLGAVYCQGKIVLQDTPFPVRKSKSSMNSVSPCRPVRWERSPAAAMVS
ncbi:hypothetical protein BSNK01_02300 [Bacillaceae bacterium]